MNLHTTFVLDQWSGVRRDFAEATKRFVDAMDDLIEANKELINADPTNQDHEDFTVARAQEIIQGLAEATAEYNADADELERGAREGRDLAKRIRARRSRG